MRLSAGAAPSVPCTLVGPPAAPSAPGREPLTLVPPAACTPGADSAAPASLAPCIPGGAILQAPPETPAGCSPLTPAAAAAPSARAPEPLRSCCSSAGRGPGPEPGGPAPSAAPACAPAPACGPSCGAKAVSNLAGSSGKPSGGPLFGCGSVAPSAAVSEAAEAPGAAAGCTAPVGAVKARPRPRVNPLDSLSGGHRGWRFLGLTGVVLPSGRCRHTQ